PYTTLFRSEKLRLLGFQRLDRLLAGRALHLGNYGNTAFEIFFLGKLHDLPRWITQHYVEPALADQHIGKGKRPVEGARRLGGVQRSSLQRAVERPAAELLPHIRRGRHRAPL